MHVRQLAVGLLFSMTWQKLTPKDTSPHHLIVANSHGHEGPELKQRLHLIVGDDGFDLDSPLFSDEIDSQVALDLFLLA